MSERFKVRIIVVTEPQIQEIETKFPDTLRHIPTQLSECRLKLSYGRDDTVKFLQQRALELFTKMTGFDAEVTGINDAEFCYIDPEEHVNDVVSDNAECFLLVANLSKTRQKRYIEEPQLNGNKHDTHNEVPETQPEMPATPAVQLQAKRARTGQRVQQDVSDFQSQSSQHSKSSQSSKMSMSAEPSKPDSVKPQWEPPAFQPTVAPVPSPVKPYAEEAPAKNQRKKPTPKRAVPQRKTAKKEDDEDEDDDNEASAIGMPTPAKNRRGQRIPPVVTPKEEEGSSSEGEQQSEEEQAEEEEEEKQPTRRAVRAKRAQAVNATRTAEPAKPTPAKTALSKAAPLKEAPKSTSALTKASQVKAAPEPVVEIVNEVPPSKQIRRVPGIGGFDALSKMRPEVHDSRRRVETYEVLNRSESSGEEDETSDSSDDDAAHESSDDDSSSDENGLSKRKRSLLSQLRKQ